MNRRITRAAAIAVATLAMPAVAQDMGSMPGMDHGTGHGAANPSARSEPAKQEEVLVADRRPSSSASGSGTSRLPGYEGGMHGLHVTTGDWMIMAHGYAWGAYTDQGGPRGNDKAYVQSMGMLTGERPLGGGVKLTLKSMFSLEPLMKARGYPNLFATGETANGVGLIDRQHPHDLFMELAARVDVTIAPDVTAFLYGGPVGEPALGPGAFMMRRSSRYIADAPITHHWFDSTHITYGVITAGISSGRFQIESSAFRGREPDEKRWGIETPKLDSWSARGTWTPSPHWAAQISYGRIKSPEALHPREDEGRLTASLHYATQRLSLTGAFSAKSRLPGRTLDAWLLEANWTMRGRHTLFGRIERVANDELFAEGDPLHGRTFRVGKALAGYAYRIPLGETFALALGGSGAVYAKPAALDAAYGKSPFSYTLFAKLLLGN